MEIHDRNGNFLLREWRLEDAVSLARNISNINIWNNVRDGLPYPYTERNAEEYLHVVSEKPYVQDLAIVIDHEAVGGIGFIPLCDVERYSAEIGYWLGEDYWNRGIMSEAIRQVVEYVFRETDIIRLFASVYEYNPASMRVLEKAGFTRQAVLRKAAVKNGKVIDMHYFDIVKE